MVIELLGVPACGKTTYMKKYMKEHGAVAPLEEFLYSSSRVRRNINKIKLVYYAFRNHSDKAMLYGRCFKKIKFSSKVRKLKMWLYVYSVLGARWKATDKTLNKELIFDEGINQVIWGLLYNCEDSIQDVWSFQKMVISECGDEIICFNIEKDIIHSRLMSRSSGGGSELEHEMKDNPTALDRAIYFKEKIEEKLRQDGLGERMTYYYG